MTPDDGQRLDHAERQLIKVLHEHGEIRYRFILFNLAYLAIIFLSIWALPYCEVLAIEWKWVAFSTGIAIVASFGLTIYLAFILIPPRE